MASTKVTESGHPHQQQYGAGQNPAGMAYIPTDEERRVFRECNEESFWYRSLPFSAVSMLLTQGLISRGILTTSSRFGSLPKVAFAGVCGYLAGKVSYMKTCQEKFKRLDNSPLGEALRHRTLPPRYGNQKAEFSDTETSQPLPSFEGSPAIETPLYSDDYSYIEHSSSSYEPVPFSASLSESSPTGVDESYLQAPIQLVEEEKSKRKPVTYEELRNRNRETYEVTMTQKAEILLKPSQERTPKKEVKTNQYGDAWEE
uniref:OCIA domain-containing protein 1 n=2 Tax=Latimeria chalumnae TaxID=7897 RepID=H3B1Y2_LATCH